MGNSWHRNLFARAGYESDWNSTSRFRHNAPQCLMPMFVSTTSPVVGEQLRQRHENIFGFELLCSRKTYHWA